MTSKSRHSDHGRSRPAGQWRHLHTDSLDEQSSGDEQRISTVRFVVLVVFIATVFTLYIGHVYRTQDIVDELQQVQRENLRLHLHHNELEGELDKATGPSVIYARAKELGLDHGYAYVSEATTSP